MPVIRLEDVSKFYKSEDKKDKRRYVAVQELNVSVEQGEFVFLIGSSGAGKTTMLKLMSGELPPDKGTVLLDDVNIARFFGPWKVRLARTFGVVSQQTMLIRKRTIMENLMMAGRASGMGRKSQAAAEKTLGLVGLPNVGSCYPAQLSIGEVRRVELARALISSPPILVLDELTANLDDDTIWDIFHLLNELNNKGTTIVMATHASQYVNIMRKRVVTLVDGRIVGDVRNGKYGDIAGPSKGGSSSDMIV